MSEVDPFDPPANSRMHQRVGRPPTARPGPKVSAREEAEAGPDAAVGFDGAKRMVRRRRRVEDKFYIDQKRIPEGWSYEWKREVVYGMQDVDHQVNLRENGWTPVPASRHPDWMPDGFTGPIKKDGMVLMERPQYLTDEARAEDYDWAMSEVNKKEQELGLTPSGQFTRDHPSVHRIQRIKRSYGPVDPD